MLVIDFQVTLVPRDYALSDQHKDLRPLGRSDSEHAQSNRFVFSVNQICQRFVILDSEHAWSDGEPVNPRGPVFDLPRDRDSWC